MFYIDPVNILNQRCDFIANIGIEIYLDWFWKIME